MARTFSTRLFTPAENTAGATPNNFDSGCGASWLHAVAQASGTHKVTRWQGEGSPVSVEMEGGSRLTIHPAGSEDEFFAQRNCLVQAFESEVGRAPSGDVLTDEDEVFWETLAALYRAYQGPTLDPGAAFGGLS